MKTPEFLTHQKSTVFTGLQAEKNPSSPGLLAFKNLLDSQLALAGNQDPILSPTDFSLSRQVSYNKDLGNTKGMELLKTVLTPTISRFEGNRDIRKLKLNSDYSGVNSQDLAGNQSGRDLPLLKKGESTITASRLIMTKSQITQKKMESSPVNAILLPEKTRGSIMKKSRPSYSYLKNHLTFIPENMSSFSDRNDNKSPFRSFDDLARSTTNRYPKMLENLLLVHEADSKSSKNSIDSQDNQLDNIKSMLRFNKLQKTHYESQTTTNQSNSVLNPAATFSNLKAAMAKPAGSKVSVLKVSRPKRLKAITFAGSESEENSPRLKPKSEKELKSKANGYFYNDSIKEGSHLHRVATNNTPPIHNHYGSHWKLYWHSASRESGAWKPDAGEGHSITTLGDVLVTYGGIGNKITNNLATYNPAKDVWTKIEARGDVPLRGRHGHTACQFEGNLVIFGGELKFNEELKFRECSNDMYIFNLERKQWKYNKSEGKIVDPRRNHTAAIHNKHMYIYGGVDIEGKFMKDVWYFNFKTNHWKPVKAEGNKEYGQAFHTMSACFNQKSAHSEPQVTEPGFYVFGGKDDDGIILDALKVLKVQGNTWEWKYPVTKGPYPPARYGHAMVFNEASNVLIIHGGRNDNLYQMNKDICLNDFRILNMLDMKWSVAASYGETCPSGRWHHSMTMYRSAIVIFGGLGFNTYLSPEMKFIETDQYIVRKLIKEQKNRKDISFAERLSKTVTMQKEDFGTSILKSSTPLNDQTKLLNFKSFKPIPTQDELEGESTRKNFRSKLKNIMLKNGFGGESPTKSILKDLQIPSLHINLKTE